MLISQSNSPIKAQSIIVLKNVESNSLLCCLISLYRHTKKKIGERYRQNITSSRGK